MSKPQNDYFLVSNNCSFDLGEFESREACMKSDYYYAMGGGRFADMVLMNRVEAHEMMRQLKLQLSRYDNTELKQ